MLLSVAVFVIFNHFATANNDANYHIYYHYYTVCFTFILLPVITVLLAHRPIKEDFLSV